MSSALPQPAGAGELAGVALRHAGPAGPANVPTLVCLYTATAARLACARL